jgi:myo-inositol catabolism protein IolC
MELGYNRNLYILAFDHRGSFQKKLMAIAGSPTAEQTAQISDAKRVIFEGVRRAVADGIPKESAGVLVDEQFGTDIAREAKAEEFVLAMPVEKSGQDEFDFDFGADFGRHIEDFDPTFAKVLVRYNPEGDRDMNATQLQRLKQLSDWLHERNRKFLFELLVGAEPHQLERAGGDENVFDNEIRPGLMLATIDEVHEAGVEPDIWKIEGLDRREDCERVAERVRADGRDDVACVVLGRGANDEVVTHWLRQGAGVPGYIGFAIGRTIWWDPLKAWLAGDAERSVATKQIAENYRRMVDVYTSAS